MAWLKTARRLLGISATELARQTGYSRDYVMRMERGDRAIPSAIYDFIGFTPEELPLDSTALLEELQERQEDMVGVTYKTFGDILYITGLDGDLRVDKRLLGLLLKSQRAIFEE